MTVLALAGIPLVVFRFRSQGVILLSFVIPYYALLCSTIVRFDRNLLPILPFLTLLAACAADTAVCWLGRALRSEPVSCAIVLLVAAGPSLSIAAYGDQLSDYALSHRFRRRWPRTGSPCISRPTPQQGELGRPCLCYVSAPLQHLLGFRARECAVLFPGSSAGVRFVITDSYTDGEYDGDARRFPVQAARYHALRQQLKVLMIIRGEGQERPGPTMTIYKIP